MSLKGRLARNILSNWTGYFVAVVTTFLLTPYVINTVGPARYGVWALAATLTGYYGLLDLGFRAGITQYLTRYLASGDQDKMNKTASTGFVSLASVGVLVLIGSILCAHFAKILVNVPDEMIKEVQMVIIIMGISIFTGFLFFTYSAVFTATQRYDVSNAIGISTRILYVCLTVLALKLGYGIIGISIAAAVSQLLDYLLRWRISKRLLPILKISVRAANRKSLGEFLSFGIWNFAISGSVRLISYTDTLVIAAFLPISAVTPFALAASLRNYFDDTFVPVGHVFFPAATELDAKGDWENLRKLYLTGSKFMFLLALTIGSMAFCWAPDFFRLWIGKSVAEPPGYPTVATIFNILLVSSMISAGQRIGYQALLGIRRVRLLAFLFFLEGVFNLILSIALVKFLGLVGVAWGTLIPAIIFQGLLQPFFVCRILGIKKLRYLTLVVLRPLFLFFVLITCLICLRHFLTIDGWFALALWAFISGIFALLSAAFVGMNAEERKEFIVKPGTWAIARLKTTLLAK